MRVMVSEAKDLLWSITNVQADVSKSQQQAASHIALMKRNQRSLGERDFCCFLLRKKQAAPGVCRRFGKTRSARAVTA
jgi:hypothetical protein